MKRGAFFHVMDRHVTECHFLSCLNSQLDSGYEVSVFTAWPDVLRTSPKRASCLSDARRPKKAFYGRRASPVGGICPPKTWASQSQDPALPSLQTDPVHPTGSSARRFDHSDLPPLFLLLWCAPYTACATPIWLSDHMDGSIRAHQSRTNGSGFSLFGPYHRPSPTQPLSQLSCGQDALNSFHQNAQTVPSLPCLLFEPV